MYKIKSRVNSKRKFVTILLLVMLLLSSAMFFSNQTFFDVFNSGKYLGESTHKLDVNNKITIQAEAASKPKNLHKNITSNFTFQDKREYVLNQYFKSRNSPLFGHADAFVKACDKYGAPKDCITTAAIARHETDLCKYYVSADTYNCMGWGGGPGQRVIFRSFDHHLDVATDVLVNQYGIKFIIDPTLMEKIFCGPQDECIGWGNRVKKFMREIDDFGVSLGVGRLSELRG